MPEENNETWNTGKSIWLRSRTNALANKAYASKINLILNIIVITQAIFITLPILSTSFTLLIFNVMSKDNKIIIGLAIITIISNAIVLFLGMVSQYFKLEDKKLHHKEMLSGYQWIAQKARRLEKNNLPKNEAKHLCRHLEETFELYKAKGDEPPYNYFIKAQEMLKGFNTLPFELSKEEV